MTTHSLIRPNAPGAQGSRGVAKTGGMAVVIGARIGAMADASEVLTSSTVKDLAAGSGLVFEDAGEHELKGVPDRWRLYRVLPG